MSFLSAILDYINPPVTTDVRVLSTGMCVLPAPKQRQAAPPKPPPADLYVIDEYRNEFGFHTATAINQNKGSIPGLTGYDIDLLKERTLWGKKGVVAKNEQCKAHWHSGKTVKESATMLSLSPSWVEKRFAAFGTALSQEAGDS